MFHQANVRDHGGGVSLLSELMDHTFDKYNQRLRFPFVCPTMEVLGAAVAARTAYAAAHVSAIIEPGVAITVQSDSAVTVPITGAFGADAERYAGDSIAHVTVPAGDSVRVDLTACAPASGGGGAARRRHCLATACRLFLQHRASIIFLRRRRLVCDRRGDRACAIAPADHPSRHRQTPRSRIAPRSTLQ